MPSTTTNVQGQSTKFDKLSFIKYMKNIGSAYRNQARELVSICRTLVQVQAQTAGTGAKLRSALERVDDALSSATKVGTKGSREVDGKLEEAINALCHYEMDCHRKDPVSDDNRDKAIRERMAAAKAKDQSSSSTLNALKEKLCSKPNPHGWSEPTNVVEFVLFKSLPDSSPIIVPQVLGTGSNVAEVLWNFSRCKGDKRITLKQNPHFYKPLPESKDAYGNDFRSDPMESFVDTTKVHVLTDGPGHVYLDSGQDTRAFGNVWRPKDAIIFKDICGKLEGESIVGASIQGNSNLRYRVEPMQPSTSTNSVAWESLHDWREPIRRVLDSNDTMSIHICAERSKPPKSLQVSPSTSSNCSLGPSNSNPIQQIRSNNVLSPSMTEHRVAALGTPSSRATSQFSSLSRQSLSTSARMEIPTLGDALVVAAGIPSSRGTSLSSSFSQLSLTTSVSTDVTTLGDVPIVVTNILSSCGTSQSAAPSQASLATSLSTDPATPAHTPIPAASIPSSDGISQPTSPPLQMLTRPASTEPATSAEAPTATSQCSTTSHSSLTMPLSTDTVALAQAPIVATRITSSHGVSQSQSTPQPSLTTPPSTDPVTAQECAPIVATGIPSSHGTSKSASPSQAFSATLPSTELATPAHGPVVLPLNHGTSWPASASQASLTTSTSLSKDPPPPAHAPSNAAPPEGTPNLSRKPDLEGAISTLNVTVTSSSETTSSHNTLAGGNACGQANVANLNLGGAITTTLKHDTKPVPMQAQAQGKPPAQRQTAGWQFWFQGSVWRR